jgi:transcriptional regulator with XRE-family HTH domain
MEAKAMPKSPKKMRPLSDTERLTIDRIRERVKETGSSMAKLARDVGQTTNAGSQWGSYRSFPRQRTMIEIAKVLGVSVNWLLSGEEKAAETPLTTGEKELLAAVRELPADQQALLLATVKAWKTPGMAKK